MSTRGAVNTRISFICKVSVHKQGLYYGGQVHTINIMRILKIHTRPINA